MNFEAEILSVHNDDFNEYYVLGFDWISMQDATGKCRYAKLVGQPLRLKSNFAHPLEHVSDLNVLGEQIFLVVVHKFDVDGKNICNGQRCSPAKVQSYHSTQLTVASFIHFKLCSNFANETFAIKNTQPGKMQSENWMMIANSRHK